MHTDEGESESLDSWVNSSPMWCPNIITPRKLTFSPEPSTGVNEFVKSSPPCRPLRTLRLTENPSTPSTIFQNSGRRVGTVRLEGRLSAPNFNPFTPESMRAISKKRTRSQSDQANNGMEWQNQDHSFTNINYNNNNNHNNNNNNNNAVSNENESEEDSDELPAKRFAIIESNSGLSRYLTEFEERYLLGTGEFGSVYKCTNRMDGYDYAIKKSSKTIDSANEKKALNEVFAHAVLGKHENVVRYFTAWAEDKHMLIQNEFCNGGSLQDLIEKNRVEGTKFSESELRQLISHVAEGLRYIHAHNLVHMDIKPGNIFLQREPRIRPVQYMVDDSFEEEEQQITYKIGDLGHVTSILKVPVSVEEGDARYLANEVLYDRFDNLTKADVFALGLTAFEAGGGGPLQKNGPEWLAYREGKVPELKHCSKDMNDLIKQMTHPDPEKRPTALQILKHSAISSSSNKTKEQLERELKAEKTKTQILEKKLNEASCMIKSKMIGRNAVADGVRTRSNSRILGKSVNRSHSTTEFGW